MIHAMKNIYSHERAQDSAGNKAEKLKHEHEAPYMQKTKVKSVTWLDVSATMYPAKRNFFLSTQYAFRV
jgi:hypothetical protein